jgi:hypothetical protein
MHHTALWFRREARCHAADISLCSTLLRCWRTREPGQSPSPEQRVRDPPPARSPQRGSRAGASAGGRSKEGHRMQALCTYCRGMTTPAPSHPGRPRLCRNCLRPYEPCGETPASRLAPSVHTRVRTQREPVAWPLAMVEPQSHTPSLPTRAPEQRARAGGDHAAPRATPTLSSPLCPYLRARNNEQTVHLMPQKRNACYARLRQQDHWWRATPWVEITPASVPRQYQAGYCFGPYGSCPYFRPVGTPEVLAPTG